MPVPYLNTLHKKTGKPMAELERLWDEAKRDATAAKKDKDHYWSYVMAMLKKKVGLSEALGFDDFVAIEQGEGFDDERVHVPPIELPPEPEPPAVEPPTIQPPAPAEAVNACTPRNLVSELFSIRDKAHQLHLRTKSFSQHVALGDFYDEVLLLADQIAEVAQGKYGVMEPVVSAPFVGDDAKEFIAHVTAWLDSTAHACIPTGDTFLHNIVDEVQASAYRAKYKLDNLA